jgi:hypothetical protein
MHVLVHNILGTAVMVEWDRFQYLIPGGVPPETLLRSLGDELTNVDVILLSANDLAVAPADEWAGLNAALYIWSGAGDASIPADDPHWAALGQRSWIEIETDGTQMWANVGTALR